MIAGVLMLGVKPRILLVIAWLVMLGGNVLRAEGERPADFVDLSDYAPSVALELRYATSENFVGEVIPGYEHATAWLTEAAAKALNVAQLKLLPLGYSLKVYDAYRPQRAVLHFVHWAKDLEDAKMKAQYYPDVPKSELFERGYIALESGHSRGSTVDVTLMRRTSQGGWREVDMGSPYDFFGPESHPDADAVSAPARALRALLRAVMTTSGFEPYDQEWWHFTLAHEPYPETYFDFPLEP